VHAASRSFIEATRVLVSFVYFCPTGTVGWSPAELRRGFDIRGMRFKLVSVNYIRLERSKDASSFRYGPSLSSSLIVTARGPRRWTNTVLCDSKGMVAQGEFRDLGVEIGC